MFQARKQPAGANRKLTGKQAREVSAAIRTAKGDGKPRTAQGSIPYLAMYPDGICRVTKRIYSKSIEFFDINYQIASNDTKTAIFDYLCDFYNYFDPSISVQFSFINRNANREEFESIIDIPLTGDEFDHNRKEYVDMLKAQLEKGNNGIIKTKYITFSIEADSLKIAKARLARIETDILNNFKIMGVSTRQLSGVERLRVLHSVFHPDGEPFNFSFDWLAKTGLSTKDYIAPTSFEFGAGRTFRMGAKIGAVSFLQIIAPELNDNILADLLDTDSNVIVNLHVRSVDMTEAIKTIKRKITDLDSMKINEQKKAVSGGWDMDILPSDLALYGEEAKNVLKDLQSRNERMFLVTVIILNTASTKQGLENNIFQTNGIAQGKHNCHLMRLDYQQEAGLMSSLPLGLNQVSIQRGLTTSAVAIFVPFMTQELFQGGESLYYGLNALSGNMIMADRKSLKNPNGLILGIPGCMTGDTKIRLADGTAATLAEIYRRGKDVQVQCYNDVTGETITATGTDPRISGKVRELVKITLGGGHTVRCTGEHLILDGTGQYVHAKDLQPWDLLSGGHIVDTVEMLTLDEPIEVYDLTVDRYLNFILDNGLIVHNSGKSFSAKREIFNVFLVTGDDIIICDPENEYSPLLQRLKGQVVQISPISEQYINPMDINSNYNDEKNPVVLKSDFILSFCEVIAGGRDGLQPIEKSVIDKAVRDVYTKYLAQPDPAQMPILEDLYNALLEQNSGVAKRVAAALEIYVHGSLNVFNHRTNIDINNRLVCFDIKDLGKQLKTLGMLVVQDQIWNRVTVNRADGKATRYYCDEFHLLLKEKQTAAFSAEIWKRFRKWGGIPTGITQNIKDFLESPEVENIFENSDFIYMLAQAPGDREILARKLNISPKQLEYVTQSEQGEGLILFGKIILPFKDKFPTDTELYRIMTTKPEEVAVGA